MDLISSFNDQLKARDGLMQAGQYIAQAQTNDNVSRLRDEQQQANQLQSDLISETRQLRKLQEDQNKLQEEQLQQMNEASRNAQEFRLLLSFGMQIVESIE